MAPSERPGSRRLPLAEVLRCVAARDRRDDYGAYREKLTDSVTIEALEAQRQRRRLQTIRLRSASQNESATSDLVPKSSLWARNGEVWATKGLPSSVQDSLQASFLVSAITSASASAGCHRPRYQLAVVTATFSVILLDEAQNIDRVNFSYQAHDCHSRTRRRLIELRRSEDTGWVVRLGAPAGSYGDPASPGIPSVPVQATAGRHPSPDGAR